MKTSLKGKQLTSVAVRVRILLGSFSNDDGNGNENVVVKWLIRVIVIALRLFQAFNVTKVWQTPENETSMNGAQFTRENEHLSSSADVLPKTLNLVISRCSFADDGKEMDKNEKCTCRACKAVVFTHYICKFLTFSLPSPLSLLKLPIISFSRAHYTFPSFYLF